jgi:nitrite reductase (NADH) large subunit
MALQPEAFAGFPETAGWPLSAARLVPGRAGARRAAPGVPRLVIVGNGMVSHRLCEHLVRLDPFRYDITIFAEETRPAYDRVHLGEVLGGRQADSLTLAPRAWYLRNRLALHLGDAVVGVDLARRIVHSASGAEVCYDKLVLATGSAPVIPPIQIDDWAGVFLLRTLGDVERMRVEAAGGRSAVVIGGGLLGLETASTLQSAGLALTVIEKSDQVMSRHLDGAAGWALAQRLEAKGITIRLATTARCVVQGREAKRVLLSDGGNLAADFVVVAAGARPRDDLAGCGLASHPLGGFMVNELLETSDPCVYAVGECAAIGDFPSGTVSPGYAMAECLAQTLLDRPAPFQPSAPCVRLKIAGLPVATAGTMDGPGERVVVTSAKGDHRSIQVHDGKLVWAQAVGEWGEWERVENAVRWQWPVSRAQVESFRRRGTLWPEDRSLIGLPPATIVCSCNGVCLATVEAAMAAGCVTVAALAASTLASTTCGSCVPSLERLLGGRRREHRASRRVLGFATLLVVTAVAAARDLLVSYRPDSVAIWDHLLRRPEEQRMTGFGLLGLMALAVILALGRRIARASRMMTPLRLAHAVVGTLLVAGLVAHTGMRLGANFNRAVSIGFLVLAAMGGLALLVPLARGARLLHEALFWPALAVLGLHVLAVYYF